MKTDGLWVSSSLKLIYLQVISSQGKTVLFGSRPCDVGQSHTKGEGKNHSIGLLRIKPGERSQGQQKEFFQIYGR